MPTSTPEKYSNWLCRSDKYQLSPCGTMVRDTNTGLIWERAGSDCEMDHTSAILYAQYQRTGGFDDWRLPTRDELKGLLTEEKNAEGMHQDPIFTGGWCCWTETMFIGATAWVIHFYYGGDYGLALGNSYPVRAVRGDL